MSKLPFSISYEASKALDEALAGVADKKANINAQGGDKLHPSKIFVPAAPFPQFKHDSFAAALKASPAHKAAVLLTARAKQSSAKQKVPMSSQQSKIVGLITSSRKEMAALETKRQSAGSDADAVRSLFFRECAASNATAASPPTPVVESKQFFSVLEAPPGTGKTVQLPIILSSTDSLKKSRIVHVSCLSDGLEGEESSRALAAQATAAKIRTFSVDTEQFVTSATYANVSAVSEVSRVVCTSLEVFVQLLMTAVCQQRRLLAELTSEGDVPLTAFESPFADVGVVSFDCFNEDSFRCGSAGGSLAVTMLSLMKTYLSLRIQNAITGAVAAGTRPDHKNEDGLLLSLLNIPHFIIACDSTVAASQCSSYLASSAASSTSTSTNLTHTGPATTTNCFGFFSSRETIVSQSTQLFEGGLMNLNTSIGHNETISTIVTDSVLSNGTDGDDAVGGGSSNALTTQGTIPVMAGRVASLAWLYSQSGDGAKLKEALGSVTFRTFEQRVGLALAEETKKALASGGEADAAATSCGAWIAGEAVKAASSAKSSSMKWLVVSPNASACDAYAKAMSEQGASVVTVSSISTHNVATIVGELEKALDEVNTQHVVVLVSADVLASLTALLPSRYSSKRTTKGTIEVFDAVLNFSSRFSSSSPPLAAATDAGAGAEDDNAAAPINALYTARVGAAPHHRLLRQCCLSASAFPAKNQESTPYAVCVDFVTALPSVDTTKVKDSSPSSPSVSLSPSELISATISAFVRGCEIAIIAAAIAVPTTPYVHKPSSVVRRIAVAWAGEESLTDILLVKYGVATLTGVSDLILACGGEGAAAEATLICGTPSPHVTDVVGQARSLAAITPLGIYTLRKALLLAPSASASASGCDVFVTARHELYEAVLAGGSDAISNIVPEGISKAVAEAAANLSISPSCSGADAMEESKRGNVVAASQIGAFLGSASVGLYEKVAPVRCRGWLSPVCNAWRNSRAARNALGSTSSTPAPTPTPVHAVVPLNTSANAQRQLHQQAIMRLYQSKQRLEVAASSLLNSNENDDYNIDAANDNEGGETVGKALTPEEVFASVLTPLITGAGGLEGAESRVALSLRDVCVTLTPYVQYSMLSSATATQKKCEDGHLFEVFPCVSASVASYLLKLRSLCTYFVEEAIESCLSGLPPPSAVDLKVMLAPLVPTTGAKAKGGDEAKSGAAAPTVRSQRTRRGATAAATTAAAADDASTPASLVHTRVQTDNVSPFIPLIRYTAAPLSSNAIEETRKNPASAKAPLITATIILHSVPSAYNSHEDEEASQADLSTHDTPYMVFRRSMLESMSYARAYCSSSLASLWLAVPSLSLSHAPIAAARRLAKLYAAEGAHIVDENTVMPFAVVRRVISRRDELRVSVARYLSEMRGGGGSVAVVGRRYESIQAFRTRRGEWATTSPLRTMLVYRFLTIAEHFAKDNETVQKSPLLAALLTVMDFDNVSALASFIETQLRVWMSVLFSCNDEDAASFGVALVAEPAKDQLSAILTEIAESSSSNSEAPISSLFAAERQLLSVNMGAELYPAGWEKLCAFDVLMFGRTPKDEAADVATFRRCTPNPSAAGGSHNLTNAPDSYVSSAVPSYARADTYGLALKAFIAHRRSVPMTEASVAFLPREALLAELRNSAITSGDASEALAFLSSLRLFCYRQQSLLAAHKATHTAIDADDTLRCAAFLRGSALRARAYRILATAGAIEADELAPIAMRNGPVIEESGKLDGYVSAALVQQSTTVKNLLAANAELAGSLFPEEPVLPTLRLLAIAIRTFRFGGFHLFDRDEARRFALFKKADLLTTLGHIVAGGVGLPAAGVHPTMDEANRAAAAAMGTKIDDSVLGGGMQGAFAGVLPPPSIRTVIDHIARDVANYCGNDHNQRREMEKRLAEKHTFLLDPSVVGADHEGAQYHGYYLYQLRKAAPNMSWLGDADNEELAEFLQGIEDEVLAEIEEARALQQQSAPETKKQRVEDEQAHLMALLGRAVMGTIDNHQIGGADFTLDEPAPAPVAEVTPTAVETNNDNVGLLAPPPGMLPSVDHHNQQASAYGADAYAPYGNNYQDHHHQQQTSSLHSQALDETALLMSRLMEAVGLAAPAAPPTHPEMMNIAPIAATAPGVTDLFTSLLTEGQQQYAGNNTLHSEPQTQAEAAAIFDVTPRDAHPLSVPPPPIPIDPTAERRYSVVVFPIPDVQAYQEAQKAEGGEVPHINLPNSLAMALGATLDRTVGPTYLIGNVARIEVPTRGLEQRAIQMGAFMCLGTRLRIIPNTRIFDNPALAHERGRGRGRGRGGRGGHPSYAIDGAEGASAGGGVHVGGGTEGRGRGGYRGRGTMGGHGTYGGRPSHSSGAELTLEPPQFSGGSLFPLPPPM